MTVRFAGLLLLLTTVLGVSLLVGGTPLPTRDLFAALLHPRGGGQIATIVWQLRVPRICVAALVGVQLAIAGTLLQGMLRNPLVDPYLTGTSAGAGAAIAVAIVLGAPAPLVPLFGFVAGMLTALLVAALARRGAGLDTTRLILAGVSLSALFSAFITLILTRAQAVDYSSQIIAFLAGSMAASGWRELALAVPYTLVGVALAVAAVPALNALRIGDVRAAAAGVNVDRAQWIILAAAALLSASAVALAGIVGFVGLIVPHIARRVVGTDARLLLPASASIGAALCAAADATSRTIVAPAELPVGVLLAFVGVPAFLYLYLQRESVRA